MGEHVRAAAVGFALVDEKIVGGGALPPAELDAAESFLQNCSDVYRTAGGSVANTMMAYGAHADHDARMYYSVGDDSRGFAFRNQTEPVLGSGVTHQEGHTGFCVIQLDNSGEIVDEITLYGVARNVEVPREELGTRDNGLVIANFNTVRQSQIMEQVDGLLRSTLTAQGLFAFRLSGAHDAMVSRQTALDVVNQLPRTPDIVFANSAEFDNLCAGGLTAPEAIFPDSRLLVCTNGKEDATVCLDGNTYQVPVPEVDQVVDVTGAGDQMMGAMLAHLMETKYARWNERRVTDAALYGVAAASRIIRLRRSRFHAFRVAS